MRLIYLFLALALCAVLAGCGNTAGASPAVPTILSFPNISGAGGTARATTSHDKLYIDGLAINPSTKTISTSPITNALNMKANNSTVQPLLSDGSGAGLSFNSTQVVIWSVGGIETIGGQFTFPATSHSSSALVRTNFGTSYKWNKSHPCLIGGVPYFVHYVGIGDDYLGFEFKDSAGNIQSNAKLSGKFIEF